MQEQLIEFLREANISPAKWNIAIIFITIILGLVIKLLVMAVVRKSAHDEEGFSYARSIGRRIGVPLNYFLPLFFLNIALPIMRIPRLIEKRVDKVLEVLLIIGAAWLLIGVVNMIQDFMLRHYDLRRPNNLRIRKIRTQLGVVRQVLTGFIIFLAVSAIFLSFPRLQKVGTGLLTGVGIGGIIIGIAAQRSIANLIAGLQIAFTQPIRLDDVLIVEGEWGRVEEITLTYVVFNIWDERRLILPITYFVEKPFENWTRNSSQILGTIFLHADYNVAVDKVRAKLSQIVNGHELWDGRVCTLVVTEATEQTVQLRCLISARDSNDAWNLRCYVREELIKFLNENYPDSLPRTRAEINKLPGKRKDS